jgi:hypothetical protein
LKVRADRQRCPPDRARRQSRWRVINPLTGGHLSLNRLVVIVGWGSVVLAFLSARAATVAIPFSAAEYGAWLFLTCAPLVIASFIVADPAARTIAQVLYDAERATTAVAWGTSSRRNRQDRRG